MEDNAPGLRFALDIRGCHWPQRVVFKTRVRRGSQGSNDRVRADEMSVPVDVDCVWIEELEGNDSEKDLHAVLATVYKVAVEEVVVVW